MKLSSFTALGVFFNEVINYSSDSIKAPSAELIQFNEAISSYIAKNRTFTTDDISIAISCWSNLLSAINSNETIENKSPKTIAYIPSERHPLRSLFDIFHILASGNSVKAFMKEGDKELADAVAAILIKNDPELAKRLIITDSKLNDFDAVIFDEASKDYSVWKPYLSKYPQLVRNRRTSIAVLTGTESPNELLQLGRAIYQFQGNSDFNVKKLLVPKGYTWPDYFPHLEHFNYLMQHTKYANAFEYRRSVFLLNKTEHWDNGFSLYTQNEEQDAPMGVVYYQEYNNEKELNTILAKHKQTTQRIFRTDDLAKALPYHRNINEFINHQDLNEFLLKLG